MGIDVPFIFIVGARGIGKTYGALKYAIENQKQFIFMRRLQTEVDLIKSPEGNPFKSLNEDLNINIISSSSKNSAIFHHSKYDEIKKKTLPFGSMVGMAVALSTIANIRGYDFSNFTHLFFDEFIPEHGSRPIKDEAFKFFNAIETISRNRELKGKPPLKVVCMANSNDLANPLFIELQLIMKSIKMIENKNEIFIDKNKGIALILPQQSPISEKKKKTALYKLTHDSTFEDMAINNKFIHDDLSNIKSMKIQEFRPIVNVGEITIYEHKSKDDIYVSSHYSGSPDKYTSSEMDIKRFKRDFGFLWFSYLRNDVYFESYIEKVIFEKYFAMV